MSIVSKDQEPRVEVDIQPDQMENVRAMFREAKNELTTLERIHLVCVIVLTVAISSALLMFTYTLARQANIF